MTKIFRLIAIILIISSFGMYKFFKITKDEIIQTNKNAQITYVKEISENISNQLMYYCKDNLHNDLKSDEKLRDILNLNLQSFITSRYKYVYILDRKDKDSKNFRFLLDGDKNLEDKSEFEETYKPINSDIYEKIYQNKEPVYFKHNKMESLYITYLYPVLRDNIVEAIIVIDFSLKEQELIKKSLDDFNNLFEDMIILFIVIFLTILWFSYIDQKREKEKNRIHNKLVETSNKLQELNDTLEIKIEEEVEKNYKKDQIMIQYAKQAQMGEMMSMIAHQWRQPLNAISATSINLSLLDSMNMLKSEKLQEDSTFIQKQCQKMSQTINTFMNFVKPNENESEFNISETIDQIMMILGTQFKNHTIDINIEIIDNISLTGYADLLEQVIINILSNARDAFEEQKDNSNKHINITVLKKDDVPVVMIEDNAGGIPKDIQDKIFNPYFTTKEQGKGTGIGLYMSLDIIKKSFYGDIIYHEVDGGSKFEIVLG